MNRKLFITVTLFLMFSCFDGMASNVNDFDVLFMIEEKPFTVEEFKREMTQILATGKTPPETMFEKKVFLDYLIDTRLLALEAKKKGIDREPDIKARIDAAVETILAGEIIRRNTFANPSVSDTEARQYYETHKDEFTRKERVLVRQIVVQSEKEAQEVLLKLQKGERFDQLARSISTDLSAKSGGLVGWLKKGQVPDAVEKAAFGLEKGKISGVIASAKGFHILRIENRQEKKRLPYEKVKATVMARARKEKKRKALEDYRAMLRRKYKVALKDETITRLLEE